MDDLNIFSFFHIPDVLQELSEKLRDVHVDRIDYYQKSQKVEIFVTADNLIDSPLFAQAEELIARQAFPEQQIKISIVPRFALKDPPPVAELLNAYHDNRVRISIPLPLFSILPTIWIRISSPPILTITPLTIIF